MAAIEKNLRSINEEEGKNIFLNKKYLHPYIVKSPLDLAKSYDKKAKLYKIAAVVSFISACIFTTLTTAFLSGSTIGLPLILVSLSIAVPIFSVLFSNLYQKSQWYEHLKNEENDVCIEYDKLKKQSSSEIENELRSLNIDQEITLEKLKQIDPTFTIKNIISPLAYYNHFKIKEAAARESMDNLLKNHSINKEIRLTMLNHVHKITEECLLPSKLSAIEALFIIQNPTSYKNIDMQGRIQALNSTNRRLLKHYDNEDIYFIFSKESHGKKYLSTQEIDDANDFDLANIIFN